MQNVDKDSVILSRDEYNILVAAAASQRNLQLTNKEADAIVYAIRSIRVLDLYRRKDGVETAKILAEIAKRLERADG